ncbi:MAG TPA: helix-turn-helix domain-containing protein, partial [Mycobacteriales bacterium]|nr:helix-turn-helix domain-containing protein [Mycobacteriales bacterium]
MVSALDVIGLDGVAETVYEALVASGPAGLPELVEFTGLPRWRVRGALDRLEVTGLVSRSGGRSRFMAGDPTIALDVLLLGQVERLNRARSRARELTERFQREITRQDPTELVEVVTGSDAIRQRSDQVQRSARHSLRILDKPPYANDTG